MSEYKRSEITFEQAEGLQPLPAQMEQKFVSLPLRAFLLRETLSNIKAERNNSYSSAELGPYWARTFTEYCLEQGISPSDIYSRYGAVETKLDTLFMKGSYGKVLGAVEYFVRSLSDTRLGATYAAAVRGQLERLHCAYRLIENSIVPIASAEEAATIVDALNDLKADGMGGAKAHLLQAGSFLTAGAFADSIRESIHAVESVARSLTGKSSLREALNELSQGHPMHPALKEGLNRIYGYTSDANGIRHPIVGDDGPQAGEPEAIFMFGACAAFVTYLCRVAGK